jgi:hypothetical protein
VGAANYDTSLALMYTQEAYSRYLDNRLKAAATYFDLRQLNREYRAEERGQRPTTEALYRIAKDRAPDRLAANHFDASGHGLVWPAALDGERFAAERERIDRMMEHRGVGATGREIQQLAEQMIETLRGEIGAVRPTDYVAAKRFLTNLRYEMDFAPGAVNVAAR